jgi:hypothetical protein
MVKNDITSIVKKSRLSQNGRIIRKKMNKRGDDANTAQQESLMRLLIKFYSTSYNLKRLHEIIDKKSGIALRLLDWYATNYIKKKDINYQLVDKGTKNLYVAYSSYQSFLGSYSKKFFDPFRRNYPITFVDKNGISIETAICQLNFFRWLIKFKNWEYIKSHKDDIENDMKLVMKEQYKQNETVKKTMKAGGKTRKKRKELSISATRTVTKHNVKVKVKFD